MQLIQRRGGQCFTRPADVSAQNNQCFATPMLTHDIKCTIELPRPRARDRVIKRHHEIGLSGVPQARFYHGPRLEVVRKRQHAEVVTKRRASASGCGQRRRYTRYDRQFDGVPLLVIPGLIESLKHGRGHCKNTGVSRRYNHYVTPGTRQFERMTCALHLFAIVGAMKGLMRRERTGHAYIGLVAEYIVGLRQSLSCCRHHQICAARAETDHRKCAACLPEHSGINWMWREGNRHAVVTGLKRLEACRKRSEAK